MSRRRKRRTERRAPAPPPSSQFQEVFEAVKTSTKRGLGKVLKAVEEDPEKALAGVGHILTEGERLVNKVRQSPPEAKRAMRNEIFSLVARGIRKGLEKE